MKRCKNKNDGIEYNFIINNSNENKNNIYNYIKSIMNIPVIVIGDKIKYIEYDHSKVINKNDVFLSRVSDKTMTYVIDIEILKSNFEIKSK